MIRIVIIFIILRTVTCIDILQLNCNEGNEAINEKCDEKSEWCVVKCDNEEANVSQEDLTISRLNDRTTLTIFIKPSSSFGFGLQFNTVQVRSSVIIAVYLNESSFIKKYIFFSNNDTNYEAARKEMKFNIRRNRIGNIDLLGYNQDNKKFIIDTIRYKNNITSFDVMIDKDVIVIDEAENIIKTHNADLTSNENQRSIGEKLKVDFNFKNQHFRPVQNSSVIQITHNTDWISKKLNKRSIGEEVTVDSKIEDEHIIRQPTNSGIINVVHSADWKSNENERSISSEVEEDSRLEGEHYTRANNSRKFGPWAITLISLGCVTVTALVAVCSYHLGKMRARAKGLPEIFDDEPPRVSIIPRVTGTDDRFEETIRNYV